MAVCTKPQHRKKDESERLRVESWPVVRFREARRQGVPQIACSRDA